MFKLCPWVTGESHIAELSGRPNLVTYRRQCKHFWKEKSRTNRASGSSGLGPSLSFTNLSFKRPHLSKIWKITRDPSHDLSSSSGALFQTSKSHSFVCLTVCAALTSNRDQPHPGNSGSEKDIRFLSEGRFQGEGRMSSCQKDCTNLRPIVISSDEEPMKWLSVSVHSLSTRAIKLATGTHRTQNACLLIFWRSDHVGKLSAHVDGQNFGSRLRVFHKNIPHSRIPTSMIETDKDITWEPLSSCIVNTPLFRARLSQSASNIELLRHSYPKCPPSPQSPTPLSTR